MRVDACRRGRPTAALLAAVLVLGALVAAAVLPTLTVGGTPSAGLQTTVSPVFPTPVRHVVVVFFENQEVGSVLANGSYFRYLAQHYAFSGEYFSVEHYSLPNYLAVTSGYTTNLLKVVNATEVGDLAHAAHETWGGFFQSMPSPCDPASSGSYDNNHNPFLAYHDIVTDPAKCDAHVQNFTAWNSDVAAGNVPNYALVVPNNTNDGHDTNVSVASAWLQGWLTPLLNDSFYQHTAFFLAFDEGSSNLGIHNTTGGGHVYLVTVSPYARAGYNSSVQVDDFNVLTSTEWLLGLGRTGHNDNWTWHPPMTDLFSFPAKKHPGIATGSSPLPAPNGAVPAPRARAIR